MLFLLKLSLLWVFAPLTLHAAMQRAGFDHPVRFMVAFCLAPAALAWVFALLLRLFPEESHSFYLTILALIFLPAGLAQRNIREYFSAWHLILPALRGWGLWFISALGAVTLAYVLFMPMRGNDPLEYFYLGGLIAEKASLAFYPSLTALDARGFIAPWTHPVGFPSLIALAKMAQTVEIGTLLAKLFVLSFFLGIIIALTTVLKQEKQARYCLLAALLFVLTPICMNQTLVMHIDNARMLYFLLALYMVYLHFSANISLGWAGLLVGASWFFHSTGVLTLILALGIYGALLIYTRVQLLQKASWQKILIGLVWFLGACVFTVAWDIANNLSVFGHFLGDRNNVAIINLLEEDYRRYLDLGRTMFTLEDRLWGIGKIFTSFTIFGLSYWLALIAVMMLVPQLWRMLRARQLDFALFCLAVIMFFYWGQTLTIAPLAASSRDHYSY